MSSLLTQAEVDALPDDTKVEVIWSGGNKAVYHIAHCIEGKACAHYQAGFSQVDHHVAIIDTVGESPLTEVRRKP